MQNNVLMPGDTAGNYNEKWTKTFDLKFMILWLVLFVFLLGWTIIFDPNLFQAKEFFMKSAVKLSVMMILALLGGMLYCKHCGGKYAKNNYNGTMLCYSCYLYR